jgi:two-component system, chemotaxis family, CheB/CheR fusion protein
MGKSRGRPAARRPTPGRVLRRRPVTEEPAEARTTRQDLLRANTALRSELTVLQQRHKASDRAKAEYLDLFDFAPVTYAMLNTSGILLNVNMAGCRLLGIDRAHLIGHPLLAHVAPADRRELLDHLRRCRTTAGVVESEMRLVSRTDGPILCRVYSKRCRNGEMGVFPTVLIDERERIVLDNARIAAELARAHAEYEARTAAEVGATKDRFLAAVSHELRTPLTPALIAAGRLAAAEHLPDGLRRLADTIVRNIEVEARLIDDLLDVARINRHRLDLRLEVLDVHDVLLEAAEICRHAVDAGQITFQMHLGATAHHVRGDRERLRQVFWNLLNNAIKFTDAGGRVILASVEASEGLIRIIVRDTGAGMSAEVLGRLFAPFEHAPDGRASRRGLGLGLAICSGIVQAHEGRIWATSDGPGCGSQIAVELRTVEVPLQDAHVESPVRDRLDGAAPATAHAASTESTEARPLRVLLVEDDADTREMLSMFLAEYGYRVEVAASVFAAIRRLEEPWDILVSDIGLPDGTGLDVARRARDAVRPPARLVALTGYGTGDDVNATREAGFDRHVVKPVDLDALLEALAMR